MPRTSQPKDETGALVAATGLSWQAKRRGRTEYAAIGRGVVGTGRRQLASIEQLARMFVGSERSIWRGVACGESLAPLAEPARHSPATDEAQQPLNAT